MTAPISYSTPSTASATGVTPSAASSVNQETMDFYNLLTTQLTNQNPLEPVSETDFLGQMAQFSTVEQLEGISKSLTSSAIEGNWLDAQGYLDREVTWRDTENSKTTRSGVVDRIYREDGDILLRVNGEAISLSQVEAVQSGPAATPPAPTPTPAPTPESEPFKDVH